MKVNIYFRKADVVRVIDGDSVELDIDWGDNIHTVDARAQLRMYGINAPESRQRTPGTTDEQWALEKVAGEKAKAYLKTLIEGKTVLIKTRKDPTEKFGRLLAEMWLIVKEEGDGIVEVGERSVNQEMVDAGHAVPYFGGKR
jgi:endonuclease YncB( thermonuclease family)